MFQGIMYTNPMGQGGVITKGLYLDQDVINSKTNPLVVAPAHALIRITTQIGLIIIAHYHMTVTAYIRIVVLNPTKG